MTDQPPRARETSARPVGSGSRSSSRKGAPTVLGRLGIALREQSWTAVVIEVLILVVGVVLGFQITAWGESRSDREREQVYLRQLAADLSETERIVADRDARMDASTHAGLDRLLRSFDTPERPSADSAIAWIRRSFYVASPRPVLGTAEALVASGDLGLIEDDALRAAILRYLDITHETLTDQAEARAVAFGHFSALFRDFVDVRTVLAQASDVDKSTALIYETLPALSPEQPWTPPFPFDVDALYDDAGFYRTVAVYATFVGELGRTRVVMRESAAALRELVEARIEP